MSRATVCQRSDPLRINPRSASLIVPFKSTPNVDIRACSPALANAARVSARSLSNTSIGVLIGATNNHYWLSTRPLTPNSLNVGTSRDAGTTKRTLLVTASARILPADSSAAPLASVAKRAATVPADTPISAGVEPRYGTILNLILLRWANSLPTRCLMVPELLCAMAGGPPLVLFAVFKNVFSLCCHRLRR